MIPIVYIYKYPNTTYFATMATRKLSQVRDALGTESQLLIEILVQRCLDSSS